MNKIGLGIGIMTMLLGVVLMVVGGRLCRTTCWIDDLVKILLPHGAESIAGGVIPFFVGLAIAIHALRGK